MQTQLPKLKADFFKALGHPLRVRVLELLAVEPQSVSALIEQTGVDQPYLSQQLAVLRRAGVVTSEREGGRVVYALADERLAEMLSVCREILLDLVTATRDELRGS